MQLCTNHIKTWGATRRRLLDNSVFLLTNRTTKTIIPSYILSFQLTFSTDPYSSTHLYLISEKTQKRPELAFHNSPDPPTHAEPYKAVPARETTVPTVNGGR
jgi:hypothetical protein